MIIDLLRENRKKLYMAFYGILFLFLCSFIVNHGIVIINTTNPATSIKLFTRYTDGSNSYAKNSRDARRGINIIGRGDYILTAKNNDQYSESTLDVGFFNISSLSIDTQAQKHIEQITDYQPSNDAKCIIKDGEIGYVCESFEVKKININTQESTTLPNNIALSTYNPVSYKKGLLTLGYTSQGEIDIPILRLLYIENGVVKVVDTNDILPKVDSYLEDRDIEDDGTEIPNLEVLTTTDSSGFALHDIDKKVIYYYKDISNKPAYTYNYSNDIADNFVDVSVFLSQNTLWINYSIDDEGSSDIIHRFKVFVKGISLDNDTVVDYPVSTLIGLDNKSIRVSFYRDNMIAYSANNLFILSKDGAGYALERIIFDVTDFVITDNNEIIFIRSNDKIFRTLIDSKNSYLLTRSDNKKFSRLSYTNGQINFVAGLENKRFKTSYYTITQNDKVSVELFDILPIDDYNIPIHNTRYYNNNLYINTKLNSLIFPIDESPATYNKNEFEIKKGIIERELQRKGLDLSKYKINFLPGP